mgnify:CR=1 FL=1
MASKLKGWWRELRRGKPGHRFTAYYQSREERRRAGESRWHRPLRIIGALLSIVVAIPLMVLPGPAVLFYAIAGLLIAGESAVVARILDRCESFIHRQWQRWRHRKK